MTPAIASLEAVQALLPDAGVISAGPAVSPEAAGMPFGQLVTEGLASVNKQLVASQGELQQLALGNAESLHQTMMHLEESRLSFQLLMQVRSRVLEAYQDVMKMQV